MAGWGAGGDPFRAGSERFDDGLSEQPSMLKNQKLSRPQPPFLFEVVCYEMRCNV
jgi:hypothetical protein